MKRRCPIYILPCLFVFVLMLSCSTEKVYHHNPKAPEEMYTELKLKKNGTFEEYLFWELQDSLASENFGILITGDYEKSGDTLFLTYKTDTGRSLPNEIFLVEEEALQKLEPITYSYHFLNIKLTAGESEKLHALPYYESIIWQPR